MNNKKIEIKNIMVHRVEGPIHSICKRNFKSFSEANASLLVTSFTIDSIGYDKHDFVITWKDGRTYKGRYDVSANMTTCNLQKQIKELLPILAGKVDSDNFLSTYAL